MPTYVTLYKLTDQGIKNVKGFSKRFIENVKMGEALGGKFIGFYSTMGEYDYVTIGEAPDDETAMQVGLLMGSQGNVRTTTLKAFPLEEFKKIIEKLP